MRLAACATGVTLALALTACASDGAEDPSTTTTAGTSTSSPSTTTSGSGSSTSSDAFPSPSDTGKRFDRDTFVDDITTAIKENPTAEVTIKVMGGDDVLSSAEGVQDIDKDLADMTIHLGDTEYAYRYVDDQAYLGQPKPFVKLVKGKDDAMLTQMSLLHAKRLVKAFTEGVSAVGDKGTEDVDGTKTTHYTAQVDTAKAYEEMGQPRPDEVADILMYDVWLDEDHLIRKMSLTVPNGEAVLTLDRWGEPVTIEAPAKADVLSGS